MRRDDSIFLIYNQENTSNTFKMTKAKTAMFLVMIICSCGLIFSITDAYPTSDPEPLPEDSKLGNNSRLVITHVVKTIEFEVGVMDDDGVENENSTDSDASEFYETDIELLNLNLLKEVVNQATGEENGKQTIELKQPFPPTVNEETTEAPTQQLQNDSLLQSNQTNS